MFPVIEIEVDVDVDKNDFRGQNVNGKFIDITQGAMLQTRLVYLM